MTEPKKRYLDDDGLRVLLEQYSIFVDKLYGINIPENPDTPESPKEKITFIIKNPQNEMYFYNREVDLPAVGDTFDNKVVSEIYEGDLSNTSISNKDQITKIEFVDNYIVPQNTDLKSWFDGYTNITTMILNKLDVSNITNMSQLFTSKYKLSSLNISSWNTQNVTNMSKMFYNCRALTSLDLSSFNTQNITTMEDMFYYCYNLSFLNLTSFNTQSTTNMQGMFRGCSGIYDLNLTSFDTSNVTNMNYMFSGCSNLDSITVSTLWSTTKVQQAVDLFYGCSNLVGGNGTQYNSDNIDLEYARIDNPPDEPGYLTKKWEE